jgi:hypothetical protein
MKKILLLGAIAACSILVSKAHAQFHASINIGVQPAWGPSGYDYAENYYLPDVEAYYCVPRHQFVYFDGGSWVYSSALPARYGNYDLYSGYKVVINERNPWTHFDRHRVAYAPYRYRHDQLVIRDRGFGRAGYGRPQFDNRGRGNDYRDNHRNEGRGWDHDNGRGRGHDNDRHDNDRRGNGRGRW